MDYVLAVWLFAGSALGNVAAYNGGFDATFRGTWEPWRWQVGLLPLVLGVVQQALLQWRQFANAQGTIADRLTNGRYVTALLISAAPSLWVFLPVIAYYFGYVIGSLLAVVVVLAVDILQEELLLQD